MHINIISKPRTGSQYLQLCLERVLRTRFTKVKRIGEYFRENIKNVSGSYQQRLSNYSSLVTSDTNYIFKIFPNQMDSQSWLEDISIIINSEHSNNILLYREDMVDNLMSMIIHHTTGINKTKNPDYTDSITTLNVEKGVIDNCINSTVFEHNRLIETYNKYQINTILKYEDFQGIPSQDFKSFISKPENLSKLDENGYYYKLNSLQNKKKLLPYSYIKELLHSELKGAGLPLVLPFKSTGLRSLEFINSYKEL